MKAVDTTRGAAADLTGHSNLEQQERIWVVQVSGDTYECHTCSRPFGVTADPSGHVIEIVLRSADWHGTDVRIGEHRTDLAVLGEVPEPGGGDDAHDVDQQRGGEEAEAARPR